MRAMSDDSIRPYPPRGPQETGHPTPDHKSDASFITVDEDSVGVDFRQRIVDALFAKEALNPALERHHIAAIAFTGTIGIGLFVTSGELIGISGSAGAVVAYIWAGCIIASVMRSLAEMVSVRPVSGALLYYPDTFVDEALGFAVGGTYWLAQCMSMATLTAAAARAADNFSEEPLAKERKVGIIVGLCALTLLSNICGVKFYGNLERVVKWFKLALLLGVCILMILVNRGVGSNKPPVEVGRNYTEFAMPESLTWAGFHIPVDPSDTDGPASIEGHWGKFLAVLTTTIYALFACMGGDIAIVTAGEAHNGRKDLPRVAQFMYLVPFGFYILGSFLVGFNVNYTEPNLIHPWVNAGFPNNTVQHSPFIIAIQHTSIRHLPDVLNACFLVSAYTTANTALFTSSRTLFALVTKYGNNFLKFDIGLAKTGHNKAPIMSIICCSLFGLLALMGLLANSFNQPILTLSAFFTGAVACVYASECIAFLRFLQGLKTHATFSGLSRDSDEYKKKFYRAYWQPFFAIFGLVNCIAIVILSGWPAIYLLTQGEGFIVKNGLKPAEHLAADVAGAYSGPILFLSLYVGYKIVKRTEIRQFKDFRNAYALPEDHDIGKDTHASQKDAPLWRTMLKEVWSYVK